jgi:hypothetical protein
MRRRGVIALLLLVLASSAAAQRPSADWRTIETAHFRVHYPARFDAWTRHLAESIEGIHARVTEFVGYVPARSIDVVVADPAGDWNGMAIPYLDRPEIILWTSPPSAESGGGDFGDWMELLTTHEMAHIVHLARPRNRSLGVLARLSPAPFGPLALESPRWLIEGYATLVEGALTGSGRPGSSFRAMVLRQFAIEGKLPSYGALNSTGGWLEGSMAYLVGSAYLEWLSEREGKESLPRLWRRMASRRGGSFQTAFRAVFRKSPRDLYDRFRAEITVAALSEEKRLKAAGLAEGEPWQRLEGGTLSPQISPDGLRLLVRRDPRRGESFLAIWELAETDAERRAEEERRRRIEQLLRDPNEVADRVEAPAPREPRWKLSRANGFSAADPRWMPDGKSVLFARRAPDADRVLRWDLYRWQPERDAVERVTSMRDVADADPALDGGWAVAVRGRFGATELVRVDLANGETRKIPASLGSDEAWPVWSHPRVSPDGRRIAALLHRDGRWRLVTLPVDGGEVHELRLPGAPAAPPAWSADGSRLWVTTDASGIWNLAAIDAGGTGFEERTRVTGGAFSPAPTPDGTAVFFLELTAKGVNLRRLPLSAPAPAPLERPAVTSLLLPREAREPSPPLPAAISPARSYRVWDSQAIRPLVNFSVGPDGNAVQLGVEGADVVDRLHWLAAGSIGDAAGPRGGTVAAAYRGLPVVVSLQLFSALEKPGRQSLVRRSELDERRSGGYLGLSWGRPFFGGRVHVEAGGGATRVRAFADGEDFDRYLGSGRAKLALRRTRGRSGFGVDLDMTGSFGNTAGASWRQFAGGARLTGIVSFASLSASARLGDTGGSPTRFDLFSIGGASSAILPPGLDRNRIESPALPAAVQLGDRFEAYRAELLLEAVPLVLYAEWLRAWSGGQIRPDLVRVAGAELRLERLIPIELPRPLEFHLGIARLEGDTPRIRATRFHASLVYRP